MKLVKIWGVYPKISGRNLSTPGRRINPGSIAYRIYWPWVERVQNRSTPDRENTESLNPRVDRIHFSQPWVESTGVLISSSFHSPEMTSASSDSSFTVQYRVQSELHRIAMAIAIMNVLLYGHTYTCEFCLMCSGARWIHKKQEQSLFLHIKFPQTYMKLVIFIVL